MSDASIASRLDDDLKTAMRARDQARVNCVRQLRSKAQEAQNASDFKGPADDAFYAKVISSYVRMLEKGIGELQSAGERGAALRDTYRTEIDYLTRFLPTMLGPDATADIVKTTVTALGAKDPKDVGRVIGAIMKDHKGRVDPGLTRKLVEEALKV